MQDIILDHHKTRRLDERRELLHVAFELQHPLESPYFERHPEKVARVGEKRDVVSKGFVP
jgi:hypothetical protein